MTRRSGQKEQSGKRRITFLRAAVATASHALAGRLEEARQAMSRLRQIDPALRLSNLKHWFPIRRS
jgi:hypothetical protein